MQHWGQWGSPKWLGSGAKGTRGARLSPAVLLQDVCSNMWLRSWASLLKDQSHYCPCAALVVQNGLFFLIIFFSNIGNCQMLQEGENPACVRAVELLPRTPWAQQEQLVVLSPATTPRRWLSCVTELQGQGHGD